MTTEFKVAHWTEAQEIQARCGEYYHATIWEWRPILCLCIEAELYEDDLDVDFGPWRHNDGAGLTTQRECDLLASAIEEIVRGPFDDGDPFADDPFFGDFLVYVDEHGEFDFVRPAPGEPFRSDCRTTGHDVWTWVAFLRNCGGFAIY